MMSAYERPLVQTLGVGVKKLSREGKGRKSQKYSLRFVLAQT